jgi:4-hydroxybenzoate polyprenyltransferase
MRPRQWTKNLAVFAALIFAEQARNPVSVARTIAAFLLFSLISGAVYVLNDIADAERDKVHPLKRLRPIASGRLSVPVAAIAAVIVAIAALGGAAMLNMPFFLTLAAFLLLQVLYSFCLKHAVILDVFAIAIGFVLRTVAGAEAITVDISSWLLICTMLLALFLALCKRRHEILLLDVDALSHRQILNEYSMGLLDQMISVVTSATLVSYALYTMSAETIAKFGTDRLIYTVPFVLYGIFRYLYLVHKKDGGGSPDTILLTDKPLIACILLYGLAVWLILY